MTKITAKVAISNRHVHLTEDIYNLLFDEEMTIKKELNQGGEYAANQSLTIKSSKGTIENVRVMGPFRSYNQVEISASDAYKLGLNPPVRESGDLSAGEAITLLTTKNEITLNNACIIAQRHLHMNNETASKLGFKNKEKINIKVSNEKGGTMDATVKITEKGYYEVHIDMDDANCFLLKSGDEVEIER